MWRGQWGVWSCGLSRCGLPRCFGGTPSFRFAMMPKSYPVIEASPGPALVADVRYDPGAQILLVGEADFTFTAALCSVFGDGAPLTATSLESYADLRARFGLPFRTRVRELESRLCGVHHEVAAADLPQQFRQASFDCIVFNFPLPLVSNEEQQSSSGKGAETKPHSARQRATYDSLSVVLTEFFESAAHVLRPGGECHLRLTDNHATARGLRSSYLNGFSLIDRFDFWDAFEKVYQPLGYRPTGVASKGRQATRAKFNVRHSSTFVFQRSTRAVSAKLLPFDG